MWSQAFLSILGSSQQVDPGPPVHQGSAARHSDLSTTCLAFLSCLLSFFDSIVSCRASLFSSYVRNLLSQLTFPTFSKQKRKKNIYKSSLKKCGQPMYKGVGLFCLALFFKGYVHLSPSSWFKPGYPGSNQY